MGDVESQSSSLDVTSYGKRKFHSGSCINIYINSSSSDLIYSAACNQLRVVEVFRKDEISLRLDESALHFSNTIASELLGKQTNPTKISSSALTRSRYVS